MWRKNSVKVKRRLVPIHSVQRQTRKQQRSDGEISYQTGSELSDKFPTHEHNATCLTPLLNVWLQRANHCGPVQVVSVGAGGKWKWRSRGREEYSPSLRRPPVLQRRLAAFRASWSRAAHLHNTDLERNRTEHTT